QLAETRRQLNDYVRELHKPRAPLGRSVFQVQDELAGLGRLASVSRCPIPDVLTRDAAFVERAAELLGGLTDCRPVLEAQGRHPWRGCRATSGSLTSGDDAAFHCGRLAKIAPQLTDVAALLRRAGLGPEQPTCGELQTALTNAGIAT